MLCKHHCGASAPLFCCDFNADRGIEEHLKDRGVHRRQEESQKLSFHGGEFATMHIKPENITVIAQKCRLTGKLKMPGSVIILGSFTGSINSRTLEICKDGNVFGSIEAENVTIGGSCEGEIACSGLLTIAKTGTVIGRVAYGTLSVELGGLLDAEVFHLESVDNKLISLQPKAVHSDE